jgi:G3E family GTPase
MDPVISISYCIQIILLFKTFFMDKTVQDAFQIDAIVTMVDSKHFQQHLDAEELQKQIAFADRLVLNKLDLIPDEQEQNALQAKLSAINPSAEIIKSQFGKVPLDEILDIRGFDLEKVLEREPDFMHDSEPCNEPECDNDGHSHVSIGFGTWECSSSSLP